MWKRVCPKCGKEIIYKNKKAYQRANRKNLFCRKCAQLKTPRGHINKTNIYSWGRLCPKCNKAIIYEDIYSLRKAIKEKWLCRSCGAKKLWEDSEYKEKQSKISKKLWENPEYIKIQCEKSKKLWKDPKYIRIQCKKSKELWEDPEFRKQQIKNRNAKEYKEKASKIAKKLWKDPKYRQKISKAISKLWQKDEQYRNKLMTHLRSKKHIDDFSRLSKERWENPKYRQKMAKVLANQLTEISSIQKTLYSILDDLDIKYSPEFPVDYYHFDCMIPRENKPDLLIECQGEYWHSLDKNKSRDKAKLTYINKYYPEFEIKYIWEHEFHSYQKIMELIKYWMGISKYEPIDYNFKDIEIKKSKPKEYKLLLSKYHYLNNAGRGGIAYGAYLHDELIAVVVFSPPVRQNIKIDGDNNFVELSRFCIHPKYQKFNFGSWFISRAIKLLKTNKPDIKAIISYSDTTFNHDGAIYKSLNFTQDKKVPPDYWYIDNNGWVMHKKTLYSRANKLSMKEKDYAQKYGYKKVYGKEKYRYVYNIKPK